MASTAAPGWTRATITGWRSNSDGTRGKGPCPNPVPRSTGDLRWRGAKTLGGLKHDGHRAGEAHQHGDEACDKGRQAEIFEKLHGAHSGTHAGNALTKDQGLIQSSDFDLGAQLHHRVVRQVQKSAAPLALWCICAKSFSRQWAMPCRWKESPCRATGGSSWWSSAPHRTPASKGFQGTRQVRVVLEAVVHHHLPAVMPQRLHLQALVQANPGYFMVAHRDEEVLLVQHLVCLRLCNSALGTAPGSAVRKWPCLPPGSGADETDSRKSLRSMASARSLALSRRRPRLPRHHQVNRAPPIINGNHPPWNSLSRLDAKNAKSTTKKQPVAARHSASG